MTGMSVLSIALAISAAVSMAAVPEDWDGAIEHDTLSVSAIGRDAAVCLIDSQGRRTGGNPAGNYDENGQTKDYLREITHSRTYVSVTGIDAPEDPSMDGKPGSLATWSILVGDQGAGNYILEFIGLQDGVGTARVGGGLEAEMGTRPRFRIDVPVERGSRPQVGIEYDPDRHVLRVRRLFKAGELARSLAIVCRAGGISSTGICQSLNAKIGAVEKAAARQSWNAARGAGKAFLKELTALPDGKITVNGRDLLRTEMESYLSQLGAKPWPPKPAKKRKN